MSASEIKGNEVESGKQPEREPRTPSEQDKSKLQPNENTEQKMEAPKDGGSSNRRTNSEHPKLEPSDSSQNSDHNPDPGEKRNEHPKLNEPSENNTTKSPPEAEKKPTSEPAEKTSTPEAEKQPTSEPIDENKKQPELREKELDDLKNDYFDDLKNRSEYPDTIDDSLKNGNWEKMSPEDTEKKRAEFAKDKGDLISQWENDNGMKWPTYTEDVVSPSGKVIRNAGDKYDAHHIQPLTFGGQNEASNITPMHASEHFDKQGVHAPDSPFGKINQFFKEE